jgi:hypothetical protein
MASRIFTSLLLCLGSVGAFGFTADQLWEAWPEERFMTTVAPCLGHAELTSNLQDLATRHPDQLQLEKVGESFLGRPIQMMTLGRGSRKVLLWSQMHGDEPSATPALLDIVHYLLSHADEPGPQNILQELTLLMIPMLNPDGSELYVRRNAQGIDINRDALNLATPEGRILKQVREQHEPMLGFNLHDQNRRTAVGDTRNLATNSVLAVAGDPEGTMTPGRLRAKRVCSALVEALSPFMPGGMARYDEDFSPRAFGDNLTAWGTPVVLIESGGLPPGHDLSELTRLNFVALLKVLQDLAKEDLVSYDPRVYEDLPRNQSNAWAEVVVRNSYMLQPGTSKPYRADLAFYLFAEDRQIAGCAAETQMGSGIFEIGDSRFIGGGREIDATNSVLVAPFVVGVKGWLARKWLQEKVLEDLARLGVGTVRWSVSGDKSDAAETVASRLARPGSAQLVVIHERSSRPAVMLRRPPTLPASNTLGAVLRALQVATPEGSSDGRDTMQALQVLWPEGVSDRNELPVIRRGQPASFLLLSPAPEGQIDLNNATLDAVWLDGVEIDIAR